MSQMTNTEYLKIIEKALALKPISNIALNYQIASQIVGHIMNNLNDKSPEFQEICQVFKKIGDEIKTGTQSVLDLLPTLEMDSNGDIS